MHGIIVLAVIHKSHLVHMQVDDMILSPRYMFAVPYWVASAVGFPLTVLAMIYAFITDWQPRTAKILITIVS